MKTFIVLTFAFLGFALYEMSGGEDFQPASARAEAPAPVAEPVQVAAAPSRTETDGPNANVITTADETPAVTRVSLNLTNVTEAAPAATQTTAPEAQPATFNAGTITDSTETPQIILPSLIATSPRTETALNGSVGDVRIVSGNRVNVRGGPSTDYGVVGKLARGDEVRVIEDNGNGWVRMESLDTGEEGWMADFLLTSG
ncbi:SH3 domain-containing protein [Sulfitobacter sp. HNIBRBA3233]|uniref:SH3 domain-containing protein n=1 Tax=Sulfitobacter marinivivus TaxID=3158558 RepID=UPI0032E00B23